MPFDHEATRIHRAELDATIETIRREQELVRPRPRAEGVVGRARRRTGSLLIAAGVAVSGERRSLGRGRV